MCQPICMTYHSPASEVARQRVAAAAAAVMVAGAVAVSWQITSNGTGRSDGPLVMTRGHMTNMLQPLGSESFIAISACLDDVDGPQRVRLDSVEAVQVDGTDSVRFFVAWPSPDQRLRIAAERLDRLEDPYIEEWQGTSGEVLPCGDPALVTGLSIATVLPDAEDTAAIVEDLRVTYTTGGETYTDLVDVTLGVCASDPEDLAGEHEYCRD